LEPSRARISNSLVAISPTLSLPIILKNYGILMQYYVNSRNELEQEINILKKLGIQNIVA
jgi:hypothetical protein